MEETLLEMVREKEETDKWLLRVEIIVGVVVTTVLIGACLFAAYVPMEDWLRILVVIIGMIPLIAVFPFLVRIEQKAGYYECQKCGHKYVPKFSAVMNSMHAGRTRYMKCPEFGQRSWQKKRLTKD